jgi:hypothetical protein
MRFETFPSQKVGIFRRFAFPNLRDTGGSALAASAIDYLSFSLAGAIIPDVLIAGGA